MSAFGVKAKPHDLFVSLRVIEEERQRREETDHSGDAQKLITSGFLNKIFKETGWDVETG